ncbi:MAG: hypothetical protein GY880_29210, partial [Planctomycetaceae bacterium]|nr:hypothetical protein [Planctomycetaceae bacterium]
MNCLPVLQNLKPIIWFPLGVFFLMTVFSPTLLFAQSETQASPQENHPESASKPDKTPTKKILFIGNSFTYWRGGLDQHLKVLSEAMSPPLGYQTKAITRGGASLKVMWKKSSAVEE